MAPGLLALVGATLLMIAMVAGAADRNITILSTDPSIHYSTDSDLGMYGNNTWAEQHNSQCDTQMLTTRLQDSVRFYFKGTAIQVRGTIGLKGGILQFNVDGVDFPPFSRSNPVLVCDAVIFQSGQLPYGQHVFNAILVAEEADLITNLTLVTDSVLSIQHIMYTTQVHSSNLVPIVAGAVGGGVFALLVAALLIWWYKHNSRRRRRYAGPSHASIEDEVPPRAVDADNSAGLVATPFQWLGPGSQYPDPASRQENPPMAQLNSPPRNNAAALPLAYGRTDGLGRSSSSLDLKRASMASASGASTIARPNSLGLPELDVPANQNGGQQQLVDQIAHRVADIMHARVGVMDQILPPPVYDSTGRAVADPAGPTSAMPSTASPP